MWTTRKCLVQGISCQKWVHAEIENIRKVIATCLKGCNPKTKIDTEVRKLSHDLPKINENESISDGDTDNSFESETKQKTVDDSFDEVNTQNEHVHIDKRKKMYTYQLLFS